MIQCDKGVFSLAAPREPTLTGTYEYDRTSSRLSAEPGGSIGVFQSDAISSQPIPFGPGKGLDNLPTIAIANSEVMKEIQDPANGGAFFVLPSQFNGAEYPSEEDVVEKVNDYIYDRTGGPRGQLAVHPSAGQFVLDNAESSKCSQGINALDTMLSQLKAAGLPFELRNGYLVVPRLGDKEVPRAVDVVHRNLHTVRILCMEGVPATGLTPDHSRFSKATHTVNLIYASAVPVQAYMNTGSAADEAFQLQIAEALSSAQYYGALKKAVAKSSGAKRTVVYLMPLGGGVFNNPWQSIAKCMSIAVEMLDKRELDLLDIRALTWEGNPAEQSTLSGCLRSTSKFREPGAPIPEFAGNLRVLDTRKDRMEFTKELKDCRVIHVKGFGSGFKEPFKEQQVLDAKQKDEAVIALEISAPDFIAVDGDPWGGGFQAYIKAYFDHQEATGGKIPKLIWAKNVWLGGDEGCLVDEKERDKRVTQAKEWASKGFEVIVYWIGMDELGQKINELFGAKFVEIHKEAKFNARGLVKIMSDSGLSWVQGVREDFKKKIQDIESPQRGGKQYFEKCSFENAAKGNLIFELLHNDAAAMHGAICFGGGESVLLEISTKYMNSAVKAPRGEVGIYPFTRGRHEEDPRLPFWCPNWVAPSFLPSCL
mmetsp:Transcript_149387/g.263717  ORF Transcript_149387/g.263717 Transcript_149387/m.263717 type:complete len:650 (+) Transcript_149387:116-2065(+)